MNELHLFAGAGGGILGGYLLGHTTVCAVEIEPYCRRVLLQRQRDGILPKFPIWDDVCTFDGNPWRGKVDIICGGFPCTDISCAGAGAGITGEKSGLWGQMARIICEVMPKFVFVENSPILTSRGLGSVLSDLSKMGYNGKWGVISARETANSPHKRDRLWLLASNTKKQGLEGRVSKKGRVKTFSSGGNWWNTQPGIQRVVNGVPNRVDRLKAIGNGQVPIVAATAWRILKNET